MTCRISSFQDGVSSKLNPLVTTGRLRILRRIATNQIRRHKQIELELNSYSALAKYLSYLIKFVLCLNTEVI